MTGKKFKKIQTAIHERMLQNQLSVQVFGDSGNLAAIRREAEREFLYMEIVNTSPVVSYVFNGDETISVGRALDNIVSIQDIEISRHQCQIYVCESVPYVKNISKHDVEIVVRHGLHREWLYRGDVYPISYKDRISVGDMVFRIVLFQGMDYIIN